MDSNEEKLSLYTEIIKRGCCKRCALRYLGYERCFMTFDDPSTCLINFGLIDPIEELKPPHAKQSKSNPCIVCLDLLHDRTIEEMLAHKNITQIFNYENKSYFSYITMPTCILVRDHSMKVHLRKEFPNFNVQNVIQIKHAWRLSIEERLNKVTKKCHDTSSLLRLHFLTEYQLENDEMMFVEPINTKGYDASSKHFIANVLGTLSDDDLRSLINVPPGVPFYSVTLKDVKCYSEPIHFIGNYCKFSRSLSQIKDKNNESLPSVEAIIVEAVEKVTSEMGKIQFKASGAEDATVRVLGEGRIFTLQITDPKFDLPSDEDCRKIEKEVNKCRDIFVKNLRILERKQICQAFEAESINPLTYRFICIVRQHKNMDRCVNAINMYQGLEVTQNTPIRYLWNGKRWKKKRKIFYIKARKVNENLLEVVLCVQRGLYIADFVTGDMKRTSPSLSEIINAKAEILVLDIVDFKSSTDCPIEDEAEVDL